MRFLVSVFAIVLWVSTALAQNEAALRQYFEGMTVALKMDMPATQEGVEVRPTAATPINFSSVSQEIKQYGIGIHQGESIMVTKVRVKDHHIEFHLGAGGYGTFSDVMAQAAANPTSYYEGKSKREKDIENELKYTSDSRRRNELQRQLDDLRRERNRDNAWSSAMNAQAQQQAKTNERQQRSQSGSRFNIRYNDGYPEGALTPNGVMSALSRYVAFPDEPSSSPASRTPLGGDSGSSKTSGVALHKGLTIAQTEQILGPAAGVDTKQEGSMSVMERRYSADGQRVTAKFVGGILIDYGITPD